MQPPSFVPIVDVEKLEIRDGVEIPMSAFCREAFGTRAECQKHYQSLAKKPDGYVKCPFGFTTRSFHFEGRLFAMTGVVAFPRFDASDERNMAKRFPSNRTSRAQMEATIGFLRESEAARADAIKEASQVLPQAFHELRKLNGAVIQYAEKEIRDQGERRYLLNIKGAAELMRNNFDILEALSNIEVMRALPIDSTVNLYDLVFKLKRLYQEKAADKDMGISVSGAVKPIIPGSQKSFPIVPAVLIENAIKYGLAGSNIAVNVAVEAGRAVLTVENRSEGQIDPQRCFERGVRFSTNVEGAGYGLYLAREIVSCHRGAIRCERKDDVVRMIVDLPISVVLKQPGATR